MGNMVWKKTQAKLFSHVCGIDELTDSFYFKSFSSWGLNEAQNFEHHFVIGYMYAHPSIVWLKLQLEDKKEVIQVNNLYSFDERYLYNVVNR